ncbi:glycosyltransferase family 4 protein [Lactonifactor longoviformis]|uniref:glycosyltransferase family 4 protein n=1 Tax=Lactonifactor longoviformis TaxID=341220 RepID=UPI00210C7252|nr:glycosyltransferase family 4 protein [Lactonifactor longoviformis]MCQ4672648.1 glycosyltransferase family 4 protein [Lactonifactor longoviformis]
MDDIKGALFVGMYPNEVNKYRNVFFQNLIFAIADKGVKCTVISPVPVTKYRRKVKEIPQKTIHKTSKGNDVTVYYPRYISASSKQIGKFNTEVLSERFFECAAIKVAKNLKSSFDFVYGHFVLYGGLAAIKIGNMLNIPSFFAYGECDFKTEVGNTYGIPKAKEIAGLTGIISVSKKNTRELEKLGFVNNIPIITVPNSTDLSLFYKMNKVDCRKKLGIPNDKYVIGFVGGFIERKGDKRLLEAVSQIDDTYVAFAGRGEDKPSGERVVFCDAMEHEQVPILLNAVDVFALPTLAEGSCNAIVEAMACGLPIVSSNLPFNDDILEDKNSIRINPMSVDEIRDAVIRLKDSDIRDKMGNNAWYTAQGLSIEGRAEKILKFIYEQMRIDL